MFTQNSVFFVSSSEGFSVKILGRAGIEYQDGETIMLIDSELMGGPQIEIYTYTESVNRWKAPYDKIVLSIDEMMNIIDNVRRALEFGGWVVKLVERIRNHSVVPPMVISARDLYELIKKRSVD